jgi:hypothetical protein
MLNKKSLFNCIFACSLFGSLSAHAALIGPSYPAPGGNSYSSGTYSGFDTSAFSALYWGSSSAYPPTAGLNGTADALTFSSASGEVETFTGNTLWLDHSTGVTITVPMELQITVTGLGANPWVSFAGVNGSDPTGVGDVVNDSAGLSFSATEVFSANVGSGYVALNSISVPTGDANSSFTGAFYSAAPVPLPASVWLMISGVGGFAFLARRRKA